MICPPAVKAAVLTSLLRIGTEMAQQVNRLQHSRHVNHPNRLMYKTSSSSGTQH
jgi:hypothetical protein